MKPESSPPDQTGRDEPLRFDTARRLILEAVSTIAEIESVPLQAALGRVLAKDLVSPFDVPAHDNSAMDGFAVRGADLSGPGERTLIVAGTATAGHPFPGSLSAGQAVRITTGAVVPAGADTVVVQEIARVEADRVRLPPGLPAGRNLRRRGEDLERGSIALPAGRRLGPADLGLIASLGGEAIPVRRRVRVALLSTGDELRAAGQTLGPGQIHDCNRPTLAGLLTGIRAEVVDLGAVGDDPARLERAIDRGAREADAIISTGGVSVGEADFTRSILERRGEIDFWQVAMRPGRPMAFGRLGGLPYFGLPGNPVAAVVAFEVLVRDALLKMAGDSGSTARTFRARCGAPIPKSPGRSEFTRARTVRDDDGFPLVQPIDNQGTGTLLPLTRADCLVMLSHERGAVARGDPVDCLRLDA